MNASQKGESHELAAKVKTAGAAIKKTDLYLRDDRWGGFKIMISIGKKYHPLEINDLTGVTTLNKNKYSDAFSKEEIDTIKGIVNPILATHGLPELTVSQNGGKRRMTRRTRHKKRKSHRYRR